MILQSHGTLSVLTCAFLAIPVFPFHFREIYIYLYSNELAYNKNYAWQRQIVPCIRSLRRFLTKCDFVTYIPLRSETTSTLDQFHWPCLVTHNIQYQLARNSHTFCTESTIPQ